MAEVTGGRGTRTSQNAQRQPQQQTTLQRPSTASPRLQGQPYGQPVGSALGAKAASVQRMVASLDLADHGAGQQPSLFPPSESHMDGFLGRADQQPAAGGSAQRQRQRPKSAAPLRTSGAPKLVVNGSKAPNGQPSGPRQFGRVSLHDHETAERPPHEVPGPTILRDLDKPRVGFPARPPEKFLRAGEGLSLSQRNKLKEQLQRHPVNIEAPFIPGTGGVRLSLPAGALGPSSSSSGCPFSSSSSAPSRPNPPSLLRTYYDNGTLGFVAVRWRGSRADALVWARAVTRGPEGGPHSRSFTSWASEPPSELDVATWLPIFIDGVREYDEPHRFLAVRGSEELLSKAGGTLHTLADRLVAPFKAVLGTREPTCVAVGLQLMGAALDSDPRLAAEWAPHYWQFAQVLNLFRSRGGSLVVDLGYNSRQVASCRGLASAFVTAFELAGGEAAVAAVRRYSPGYDPAVTEASMDRAAAKAAARAVEAGLQPGAFKPFTLF